MDFLPLVVGTYNCADVPGSMIASDRAVPYRKLLTPAVYTQSNIDAAMHAGTPLSCSTPHRGSV